MGCPSQVRELLCPLPWLLKLIVAEHPVGTLTAAAQPGIVFQSVASSWVASRLALLASSASGGHFGPGIADGSKGIRL